MHLIVASRHRSPQRAPSAPHDLPRPSGRTSRDWAASQRADAARIPVRGASTVVAGVFDQRIFRRQRIPDRVTRQIGHLQMDSRDPRQTLIVGVQCRSHSRQAGHEPVDRRLTVVGAFQQPLDLTASADNKPPVAAFDQRRAAEQHAIVGAGEPEILRPGLAQTPHLMHGFLPRICILGDEKAQRRLLRSTAKRRPAVSRRNEDEDQAMKLVIASAGVAIQPWLESWIAASLRSSQRPALFGA